MTGLDGTARDRLAGLEVPGPTYVGDAERFWEGAADRRFLLKRCGACAAYQPYPTAICRSCWSDDLSWHRACGYGRITTWTVVHRPVHPGWNPVSPYVLGIIALDEGPGFTTQLSVGPGQRLWIGARVRLDWTKVGGQVLPFFALAPEPTNERNHDV